MRDAGRRPMGRLFYWALVLIAASGFWLSALGVTPQGGTSTTTVSDMVYMADMCMNASAWAKGEKVVAGGH